MTSPLSLHENKKRTIYITFPSYHIPIISHFHCITSPLYSHHIPHMVGFAGQYSVFSRICVAANNLSIEITIHGKSAIFKHTHISYSYDIHMIYIPMKNSPISSSIFPFVPAPRRLGMPRSFLAPEIFG